MCKLGCVVGESGIATPIPDRGGGAPPTPPPRPEPSSRDAAPRRRTWPSAAPSTTPSTRRTGSRSRPSSGLRCREGVVLAKGIERCVQVWTPERLRGLHRRRARRASTRSRPSARKLKRFFSANSLRHRPRRRRPRDGARFLLEHGGAGQGGRRHRRRRVPRGLGPRRLDATTTPRCPTSSPTSPPPSAMLVDMTIAARPGPGRRARRPPRPAAGRDRRRLHVRRRRPRAPGRRPPRARPATLIAIDRDPAAEERFAELAADVACRDALHPRAVRRRRSSELRDEGVRADLVYLDLGMSSMQVDTARARLLLRLRRAAGHAHGPRRTS